MEKLAPQTDGSSKDIVADNIEKLRQIFPDVFREGKVEVDALRAILGDYVEDQEERYNFTWHGKAQARRIAQTPSTGTLRPVKEESVNWDTTQNLFIEGDNLEVLKLLQKSYHNQVKMIYIDPPYNTGNEFIYPDKFQDNLDTYLQYTGQKDSEGRKFSTNTDSSGRYHTNWLNMMYPRLRLARNLLRDDGVIFISIDDNEVANLRKICDEILGEENFVAQLVWEKTRKNDAKFFSVGHEYMLCFARDLQKIRELSTIWREAKPGAAEIHEKYKLLKKQFGKDYPKMEMALRNWYKGLPNSHPSTKLSRYKHIDEWGPWRDRDISWPGGGGPRYDIIHPETKQPCAVPERGWGFSTPESMQDQIKKGLVVFREDHTKPPFRKAHLLLTSFESNGDDDETAGLQVMPTVIYKQAQVAIKYLRKLMDGKLFDNPKDHEVLSRIISYVTKPEDIILDFFSGSCSAAQASLDLNKADNGSRKFIMVQLPEPCDEKSEAFKAGYKTIADIGKERIRRVINKIKAENPDYNGDLGFKVFKLDSSNIKPWDADFESLEGALLDSIENIKADRNEEDVLYEILLKYGLDLTLPIDTRTIGGKTVYAVGLGALIICLDSAITLEVVEGIAQLKEELQPAVMRVVFRDNGFKDDVVKTNAIQILRQHGIDDVKSL